jgi:hypothetical protein
VKTFLAKHCCGDKPPPPSVLLITHQRIFLVPSAKTALKGNRFQDVGDIERNVTAELNAGPFEAFADCFQKFFKRCNRCIQVSGDYFEQKYNNFYFLVFSIYFFHAGPGTLLPDYVNTLGKTEPVLDTSEEVV